MHTLTLVLAGIVALEHLYFLYLEMFAWTKPATRRAFGTTTDFAEQSKTLAANQGLYNGFLAAGLIWAILAEPPLQRPLILFFTAWVIAAMYGRAPSARGFWWFKVLLPELRPPRLYWPGEAANDRRLPCFARCPRHEVRPRTGVLASTSIS
jgi:putative membrane protein